MSDERVEESDSPLNGYPESVTISVIAASGIEIARHINVAGFMLVVEEPQDGLALYTQSRFSDEVFVEMLMGAAAILASGEAEVAP